MAWYWPTDKQCLCLWCSSIVIIQINFTNVRLGTFSYYKRVICRFHVVEIFVVMEILFLVGILIFCDWAPFIMYCRLEVFQATLLSQYQLACTRHESVTPSACFLGSLQFIPQCILNTAQTHVLWYQFSSVSHWTPSVRKGCREEIEIKYRDFF